MIIRNEAAYNALVRLYWFSLIISGITFVVLMAYLLDFLGLRYASYFLDLLEINSGDGSIFIMLGIFFTSVIVHASAWIGKNILR